MSTRFGPSTPKAKILTLELFGSEVTGLLVLSVIQAK